MKDVKKADALAGARGNSFMQQSVARGIQASGENGGSAAGIAFMGMGMNAAGGMMSNLRQPVNPAPVTNPTAPTANSASAEDPTEKLMKMKQLLDAGAISQEDYDKVKVQILGF